MSSILITVLDQPKRESILKLRGLSRQKYEFRWARVGSRGFYALPAEDQRTLDDLFRSNLHHRTLGAYIVDSEAKNVEAPNYDKFSREDLIKECERLEIEVGEKDTGKTLRRLIDCYWQGQQNV